MRTTDRIGFKLIIKEPDTAERTIVVCPRYDGLKLKWTKASGKVYHNKNIEGNVEFWGVDFVTLHNCALRTKFTLVIFYKGRGEVARCEFRKTDCEWDIDHGTCKVDVSVWDKYKKLEDGKDNEYNVTRLGLSTQSLKAHIYPAVNVYIHNRESVYIFKRNSYSNTVNTGVEPQSSNGELNKMGFPCDLTFRSSSDMRWLGASICSIMLVEQNSYGFHHDVYKRYDMLQISFDKWAQPTNEIKYFYHLFPGGTAGRRFIRIVLTVYSDGLYWNIYYYEDADYNLVNPGVPYGIAIRRGHPANQEQVWTTYSFGDTTDISVCHGFDFVRIREERIRPSESASVWCRNLIGYTRQVSRNGAGMTVRLPENDVYKGNYIFAKPNPASNKAVLLISDRSDEDEYLPPWGQASNWVPVLTEEWGEGVSYWLNKAAIYGQPLMPYDDWNGHSSVETLFNFYELGDVIKAVIGEVDSSIVFEKDVNHSGFLYSGINPVSQQPQGILYISQKSNILNLNYDYPAWLAPIKWSQIETFLKNALGCYYHIDENNHLHIEHITYYENGGSYYTNDRTLLDVTALIDVANRQPVAGKTNQWTWDKDGNGLYSSANRYEYSWMDTQSEIFDGATIVIPDEYKLFTEDKLDDRKIDWFSSDIDFLIATPTECSSDGFIVVITDSTNGSLIMYGDSVYGGQNYYLSLEYLQPKYLIQGIYAEMVRIGNTNYPNTFMARMRTAEVEFTMPAEEWETNPVTHETHDTWVSPDEIIKTDVDEGLIDNLEVDLHNGKWKATIRYENE